MNITVLSLTDHRIDIKFADYIAQALCATRELNLFTDFLIVTNGMYDSANIDVLDAMRKYPSIYFVDDHTCWIPSKKEYPLCRVYSQFVEHPLVEQREHVDGYFQVSKLALFDGKFDNLQVGPKIDKLVYWGQYKEEREREYKKHLPPGIVVIGRRYPKHLEEKWEMLPFTKDLDALHDVISQYSRTVVFGDDFHNGVNLPYRIYEALMCGCMPMITTSLLSNQSLDIDFALDYLDGNIDFDTYFNELANKRADIVEDLYFMVEQTKESYLEIEPEEYPEDKFMKQAIRDAGIPIEDSSKCDVTEILQERGTIYGSYEDGIVCRANILGALNYKYNSCNGKNMPEALRIAFSDMALKLMRAASDPTHKDSWLDLAGYAKLINEMVQENENVFNN